MLILRWSRHSQIMRKMEQRQKHETKTTQSDHTVVKILTLVFEFISNLRWLFDLYQIYDGFLIANIPDAQEC
jgi:hypothetical protein